MQTRRTAVFTACTFAMFCSLFATAAMAADASAKVFVTKIYDAYKGKNGKGILIETEVVLRRYFEPSTCV